MYLFMDYCRYKESLLAEKVLELLEQCRNIICKLWLVLNISSLHAPSFSLKGNMAHKTIKASIQFVLIELRSHFRTYHK